MISSMIGAESNSLKDLVFGENIGSGFYGKALEKFVEGQGLCTKGPSRGTP
jgi:hypothetical protein